MKTVSCVSCCTAATFKMKLQQSHCALFEKAIIKKKKHFCVKSSSVKMLISCISGFKILIQLSFIIFQCVFLWYSCCFSLHLHMHVHPPPFKVQCRLGCDWGSRQTGANILPKYFVRIWINFRRCEQSMITHFLSVCWPIILEANFYISVAGLDVGFSKPLHSPRAAWKEVHSTDSNLHIPHWQN